MMTGDYYDDRLHRSGINLRACFYSLTGACLMILLSGILQCAGGSGGGATVTDTVTVVERDTVTLVIRDTVPSVRRERIVSYVPMPFPSEIPSGSDSGSVAHQRDSLAVVQREYSDDSTYTAWVSGLRYADLPRLDSISIMRREVTERIRETVTSRHPPNRWYFGLQAGYGLGLCSRRLEPYVGVGIGYGF